MWGQLSSKKGGITTDYSDCSVTQAASIYLSNLYSIVPSYLFGKRVKHIYKPYQHLPSRTNQYSVLTFIT